MKIDCQTHVLPEAYIDVFSRNPQPPRIIKEGSDFIVTLAGDRPVIRGKIENYGIERKIKAMDDVGIDMSILSPNIPGPCMMAPELALRGAQIVNDFIAEAIQTYPDRFAGVASLPWQNADEAIGEMDRARDELNFRAVMLFSNIGGRHVDDPEFEPIYAHAESKGLPIIIHPTFPAWGAEIKDYMMIPMLGFQIDSSFALLRIILSGLLERHPDLQILMPHAGGVLPYMIGRVDYQTRMPGRTPEHISKPPSEYLKRVYLDTCSPSVQALQYAFDFSGPERMVLGTDHPWVDPQLMITLVEDMNISEQEKMLIFSGNAGTLLGISP